MPEMTLLGQWLEETRVNRGQTVEAVAESLGIHVMTWMRAREPGLYLQKRIRHIFSEYLDVSTDVVDRLYRTPGMPDYETPRLPGGRIQPLSRLGREIDAICRRRGLKLRGFAERFNIHPVNLSKLRALGATAGMATWARLAEAFLTTPEQIAAWAQEPAPETGYPRATWIGTKYHPTIRINGRISCETCPFRAECERDVKERDGFAWCEELIPVDLDPDHVTVSREAIGENYV
jgi:hypothetical protein